MDMKSDRALLAAVLTTVRYPLILVDSQGRIEAASHAAADFLTISPAAICGSSIGEVTGSHGHLLHDAVASVVASGASFTTQLRNQGRWFDVVVDPVAGKPATCPEPRSTPTGGLRNLWRKRDFRRAVIPFG